MPDYDKLLQANLPQALESAIEEIDTVYDIPKQLLQADISKFENLECCVFLYFDRDDIFYLNEQGRSLLTEKLPTFGEKRPSPPAIFWLEEDASLAKADDYVSDHQKPIFETRELITLSWGKTWLHGAKFPIRARQGSTIALLFAGHQLAPSKQIKLVAEHYRNTQQGFGDN